MTQKEWIVDHLDADKLSIWLVANGAKFSIEVASAAILVFPLFAVVYGLILYTQASVPFGVAGPVALYILFAGGAYREYWNCKLGSEL